MDNDLEPVGLILCCNHESRFCLSKLTHYLQFLWFEKHSNTEIFLCHIAFNLLFQLKPVNQLLLICALFLRNIMT